MLSSSPARMPTAASPTQKQVTSTKPLVMPRTRTADSPASSTCSHPYPNNLNALHPTWRELSIECCHLQHSGWTPNYIQKWKYKKTYSMYNTHVIARLHSRHAIANGRNERGNATPDGSPSLIWSLTTTSSKQSTQPCEGPPTHKSSTGTNQHSQLR